MPGACEEDNGDADNSLSKIFGAFETAGQPPPSNAKQDVPDRVLRRREHKKEYSKQWRENQKNQVRDLESSLAHAQEECTKLRTRNETMQSQIAQLLADASAMTALQEENAQLREALRRHTEQHRSTSGPSVPSEVVVCGEQVALHALPADLSMLSVGTDDLDWSGFKRPCSTSLSRLSSLTRMCA